MRSPDPKIKYVTWRNGRPRFSPSPSLREQGYEGKDLRHDDGSWMSAGDVLEWSRAFQQQLGAKRVPAGRKPKKKTSSSMPVPVRKIFPVSQLLEEWLNPAHNLDIADLAKKTTDEYVYKKNAIEKHAPDIYHAEAAALDKDICEGLYEDLRRKAGLATAVGALRVLGAAYTWGLRRRKQHLGGMLANPTFGLGMKKPKERVRVGSIEEIERLVFAADAMGRPEIGDMIIFAVWTGQRQADRLLFCFAGERDGRMIFRQQKTGAIVAIKKAPELLKRMEAAKLRRAAKNIETDYVIYNERAEAPFFKSYYSGLLLDIRHAAAEGLPDAMGNPTVEPMPSLLTLTDQDFRDTAVTWLARAGCTIPEICAITGHSFKSATEILKHYLALDEGMADSAIDKLTAWYEKERA
jgi:integrase